MAVDLAASSSEEGAPISAINVTPFVDVVLVLLVIFMVTAPMLAKDVLGLQLPKSQSSDSKQATSLGVAITKGGQILLNGRVTGDDELQSAVQAELARDPSVQAVISADQDTRHGDVVRAMDLLKRSGLKRFGFQVRKE